MSPEIPSPDLGQNNGNWQASPDGGWVRATIEQPQADVSEMSDWAQTADGWERTKQADTSQSMAEVQQEPNMDEYDKNTELLQGSEMGVLLAEAYRSAVNVDPRLGSILIVPYDDTERGSKGSAFARYADKSKSGKHEIHVRLGTIDESLNLMQETLDKVPGLREQVADMLQLQSPNDLTPMQLHTFVMLHEMGHLVEAMDYGDRLPDMLLRQKQEKVALPLAHIATSALIDPDSAGGKFVRDNWDTISQEHGVSSIEEFAQKKNAAHRSMTSEAFADNFAAGVLVYEPTLMDQLGNADLTQYKNWYQDQAA